IYISGLSTVNISDSQFLNNAAGGQGGAIYSSGYQYVSLVNTKFSNNFALDLGSEYYGLFSNYMTYFENVVISSPAPVTSIYGDSISFKAKGLEISSNNG